MDKIKQIWKKTKENSLLVFIFITTTLAIITPIISSLSAVKVNPIKGNTGATTPYDYRTMNYPKASIMNNIKNLTADPQKFKHLSGNYPKMNSDGRTFDERSFVKIKDLEKPVSTYQFDDQLVNIEAGKTYTIYMYYHNNGSADINRGLGATATNVRAVFELPETLEKDKQTIAKGYIKYNKFNNQNDKNPKPSYALNALQFKSKENLKLTYINNSAKNYTHNAQTATLSDSIVTKPNQALSNNSIGALVGENRNGVVKACQHYSGYVLFNFKAEKINEEPKITIEKKILRRKHNTSQDWSKSATIYHKNGEQNEQLMFYIRVKNTGGTFINNVNLKDILPKHLYLDKNKGDFLAIRESKTTGRYLTSRDMNVPTDKFFSQQGFNFNFGLRPGESYYMQYTLQPNFKENNTKCDSNLKEQNIVTATTNFGKYQDSTNINLIWKECTENKVTVEKNIKLEKVTVKKHEEPEKTVEKNYIHKCDNLTINPVNRTEFTAKTSYTLDNVNLESIVYDVKDSNGRIIKTTSNDRFSINKAGIYQITATVKFNKEGIIDSTSSINCQKNIQVHEEIKTQEPFTCNMLNLKKTGENKYSAQTNFSKPRKYKLNHILYTIVDQNKKTVQSLESVNKVDFSINKAGEYEVKSTISVNNGKENLTVSGPACKQKIIINKEILTPTNTPSKMTATGPAEIFSQIMGLLSLVSTTYYYIGSRKK